jgi:hypothetical protein
MKRSFLVIWAVASTTLLLLFLLHFILDSSLFAHRGTDYYYPDDLKRMALPSWTLTKPPPVAVERAVAIAREHVETKYQERAQWSLEKVSLEKEVDSIWVYEISLVNRSAERQRFQFVKVLMNGEIWTPSPNPR